MSEQHNNQVYVLSLNDELGSISDLENKNIYCSPAETKYFKNQPEYLGFRYDGELKRISHVDKIELEYKNKTLHLVFILGPNLINKNVHIKSGDIWHLRAWADFDLLFTSSTVREALIKTKERNH